MKQITGLVMELKTKTCIILTRSGEFREVRRPLREVRLGEEITAAPAKTMSASWKPLLAAASIFLLLWAGFLYYGWLNEAVAYVGLDLNPSVELGINRRQQVCEASGLDAEGRALVQKVTLKGLPLDEAVRTVLTEAVAERYLQPAAENVVLTTVTAVKEQNRAVPEKQQISRWIQETLQRSGVKAEVVVEEAPAEVRRQAKAAGLSTGKYLQRMRGLEKRELPGPAGVAGPPSKNAAGRDENAGRGVKGPSKATDFTGAILKEGPPWAPGKGARQPPGKRDQEMEKKEPERDVLRSERDAPGEERQPEEEIKKRLDEIRSPLPNLFPPGKRPFDERPGNDREQAGDDDRAKTGGRPLLDRAAGSGPEGFFAFPAKGLEKPPSPLLPGHERELPKAGRLFPEAVPLPLEKPAFEFFREKENEAEKIYPRRERPALYTKPAFRRPDHG